MWTNEWLAATLIQLSSTTRALNFNSNVMATSNHQPAFSEEWADPGSWEDLPSSKPALSTLPTFDSIAEEGLLGEDLEQETVLPRRVYKQGDTIGL